MSLRSSLKYVPKLAGALVVAGALFATSYAAASHPLGQPDGFWVTIHDDNVTKKSILKMFTYREKVYGKVHTLLQKPQDSLCKDCKGALHCKPIKGMLIMRDLQWNEDKMRWDRGRVVDPESGGDYYLYIKYENDEGTKILAKGSLDKRGLIGRKQHWVWATPAEVQRLAASAPQTGADNGECAAQ